MQEFDILTMDNFHQTKVEVPVPTLPKWFWWVVGGSVVIVVFFAWRAANRKKAHAETTTQLNKSQLDAKAAQAINEQLEKTKLQLEKERQLLVNSLSLFDARYLPYRKDI